jgi:hypothetical protein
VSSDEAMSGQTFLQDIANVDRTDLNDEYLENMATFLQSIDSDDSSNILITSETSASLANANIDLSTASEEDVQALVTSVGGNYVNEEDAMEHVQNMLEEHAGIDESAFDVHIDDSLNGVLATSPAEGVAYATSSGLEGVTDANGEFIYAEGDSITFTDEDSSFTSVVDSANIGENGSVTFSELASLGESTFEAVEMSSSDENILANEDEVNSLDDSPSDDNPSEAANDVSSSPLSGEDLSFDFDALANAQDVDTNGAENNTNGLVLTDFMQTSNEESNIEIPGTENTESSVDSEVNAGEQEVAPSTTETVEQASYEVAGSDSSFTDDAADQAAANALVLGS